jgi:lipopolysaccharide assembly outer membrane protein LptD (OstA)
MRKGLLIALVLLGTVITGSAQTSQKTSNPLQVTVSQTERIGDDTYFSRNVVIVLTDGSKITADTATFHTSSNTVDLTGSVRLTLKSER